jgi:hypothetical protein
MPDKKQKKQSKKSEGGSRSCCKWFFGSFLLVGLIGGLIAYDTHALHGGVFEESSVGRILKQTGKFADFFAYARGHWPHDIEKLFSLGYRRTPSCRERMVCFVEVQRTWLQVG